jgi:hypothetical protein
VLEDVAAARPQANRRGSRWNVLWVLLFAVLVPLGAGGAVLYGLNQSRAAGFIPQNAVADAARPIAPRTAALAATAVLRFLPSGAEESVRDAILNATGHSNLMNTNGVPGKVTVTPATPREDGRWQVSVRVPVDLHTLEYDGEIAVSSLPGGSQPQKGRLAVNAPDGNVYALKETPGGGAVTFTFTISRSGELLWAKNLNAVAVITQAQAID